MAKGKLNLSSLIVSYGDINPNSNPEKKYVDWQKSLFALDVSNPRSESFAIAPGSSLLIFDGTRATSLSDSTELQLALSTLAANRYRFTWDGTGTNPAFRTDRGLTLSTKTITATLNSNNTLTFASQAGDFTAVLAGDTIFIPDTTTGDSASPFNVLNVGYWLVLSKNGTSSTLQLARPYGTDFTGITESVLVAANAQVQAFSVTGVQIGDNISITAGFSTIVHSTYEVVAINPKWFEVLSTSTLPISETAVPGSIGAIFYTNTKRFIHLEADQPCLVRINGDSGNTQRLDPWSPGDPDQTAEYTKHGSAWAMTVVNLSSSVLNLTAISAE